MLFTIRKCAFRIESHFFKRFFTCSTVRNNKCNKEEYVLNSDEVELRREHPKFLKVAIIGLPNAGKSTLINHLTKRNICPTSSKVHTTIHKHEAVYSEGDTQLVFMDTPGLATPHEMKKYNLRETFKNDPQMSIVEADVIGILQDVTNVFTRHTIKNFILDYLKNKRDNTPLLLIFNKVDKLKKKFVLLELTKQLTNNENFPKFDDIFMVSALTGDGIDDLRNYLLDSAKIKDWQYERNLYTDQPLETIVEETVRAKLLDNLQQEIPYKIKIETEHFDFGEDGSISVVVLLECAKQRYEYLLLKNKGQPIKHIAMLVEKELRHAFRTPVTVRLGLQCKNRKEQKNE